MFHYWRMWTVDGRTFAERIKTGEVQDARRRHGLARGWSWVVPPMTDPSVSALMTSGPTGSVTIAPGDDRDRPLSGSADPRGSWPKHDA